MSKDRQVDAIRFFPCTGVGVTRKIFKHPIPVRAHHARRRGVLVVQEPPARGGNRAQVFSESGISREFTDLGGQELPDLASRGTSSYPPGHVAAGLACRRCRMVQPFTLHPPARFLRHGEYPLSCSRYPWTRKRNPADAVQQENRPQSVGLGVVPDRVSVQHAMTIYSQRRTFHAKRVGLVQPVRDDRRQEARIIRPPRAVVRRRLSSPNYRRFLRMGTTARSVERSRAAYSSPIRFRTGPSCRACSRYHAGACRVLSVNSFRTNWADSRICAPTVAQ